MGDVVFFKNPQLKNEIWSEIERELTGMFVLHGYQKEILPALLARSRSVWDLFLAEKIQMPFTFKPIHDLTAEQAVALKKQIEDVFLEEFYRLILARWMALVMKQFVEMETELYRLRKEAGE